MSKLSDYSKFDHLDSDDDDEEENRKQLPTPPAQQSPARPDFEFVRSTHSSSTRFVLQQTATRRSLYEWEQTLNDVTLYIGTPPGAIAHAHDLVVQIQPNHLAIGRRLVVAPQPTPASTNDNNNDTRTPAMSDSSSSSTTTIHYFMNEPTFGTVEVAHSTWTWDKESHVLTIELLKANKGVVWEAVVCGSITTASSFPRLSEWHVQEEKQRLLLERWQEENPGMDFRGATFNGSTPDPRTFMGGVRYE